MSPRGRMWAAFQLAHFSLFVWIAATSVVVAHLIDPDTFELDPGHVWLLPPALVATPSLYWLAMRQRRRAGRVKLTPGVKRVVRGALIILWGMLAMSTVSSWLVGDGLRDVAIAFGLMSLCFWGLWRFEAKATTWRVNLWLAGITVVVFAALLPARGGIDAPTTEEAVQKEIAKYNLRPVTEQMAGRLHHGSPRRDTLFWPRPLSIHAPDSGGTSCRVWKRKPRGTWTLCFDGAGLDAKLTSKRRTG